MRLEKRGKLISNHAELLVRILLFHSEWHTAPYFRYPQRRKMEKKWEGYSWRDRRHGHWSPPDIMVTQLKGLPWDESCWIVALGVHDWLYYAYRRWLKYPFFLGQGLVILGKCQKKSWSFQAHQSCFHWSIFLPKRRPKRRPSQSESHRDRAIPTDPGALALSRFSLRPNRQ